MAVNPALYLELSKALSRPSKAYRAASAALEVPEDAVKGYAQGTDLADKFATRRLANQTLEQALGGNVPDVAAPYSNLTVKQFEPTAKLLLGLGALEHGQQDKTKSTDYLTQDQARKSLMGITGQVTPQDEAFLQSFGTNPIPHNAFSNYQSARSSASNMSFVGNDSDGNPVYTDRRGNRSSGNTPNSGPILPKTSTMPTAATRSSGEFANTLIPHIDEMRNLIEQADAKGYIGPAAGRVYGKFLSGKVGTTGNADADLVLGRLRAEDTLMKSGAMKVHFGSRGGGQMYDTFSNVLNTGKQSAAQLNGALSGIKSFMQGYSEAGRPGAGYGKGNSTDPAGQPFGGKSFNSEQEAEASGYKGPAMIGGKRAVIH